MKHLAKILLLLWALAYATSAFGQNAPNIYEIPPQQIFDMQHNKLRPQINSMERAISAEKSEQQKLKLLKQACALTYNCTEEVDFIKRRLELAEKIGSKEERLECYTDMCRVHYNHNDLQEVRYWAKKVYDNCNLGNIHWITVRYYEIELTFWLNDIRQAWSEIQQLDRDVTHANYRLGIAVVALLSAELYSYTSQDAKASALIDSYLPTFIETNNWTFVTTGFDTAISFLFFVNKPEDSKQLIQSWSRQLRALPQDQQHYLAEAHWLIDLNWLLYYSMTGNLEMINKRLESIWDNTHMPTSWTMQQYVLVRAHVNEKAGRLKLVENDINYLLNQEDKRYAYEYKSLLGTAYANNGKWDQASSAFRSAVDMLRTDLQKSMVREVAQYGQISRQFSEELETDEARLRDAHNLHMWLMVLLTVTAAAVVVLLIILYFNVHKTTRLKRLNENLEEKRKQIARLNEDLKDAIRQEEESNVKKNEFMAAISHEIRTPLNAIVGFSEIIAESLADKSEENREFMSLIRSNSDLMLKLVDQIIDSDDTNANCVTLTTTNVTQLAHTVLNSVGALAIEGIRLIYDSDPEEILITTDRFMLQQMLTNLVGNAVKFTSVGSITMSVHRKGNNVQFAVTDTGCGIKPGMEQSIFERFEKASENSQGFGLGLYISRSIADKLHGTLYVDSSYRHGARFVFMHPTDLDVQLNARKEEQQ
ncbi:MAG: sensor histidine kinase [Muribaculaceae bacterium]